MEISAPPQIPKFLIPHVNTFVSVFNAASKIYHWKFDEALKNGPENALAMRRDSFIMGCLRERQYPVARMKWHIEPEDKDDPAQQSVAEEVQKVVEAIPRLRRLKMQLLEAVWYGRYGAQVRYLPKLELGRRWYVPTATEPVNGDKIQFTWDGTPAVMVYGPACEWLEARGADVTRSERAPAVLLRQPYWRERFIIHKHECLDNDFFEGDLAGGVHGIGVRHYIYWMWWLRQEVMTWMLDFAERAGCGLWVWYYEAGNDTDRERVQQAAKDQNRTNYVVWPRPIGQEQPGPGVEFIATDMSGAEFLQNLVVEYFEGHIRRFIVGQELSAKSSNVGLGAGSGQAELQGQTKDQIIEHDANNLDETLTEDLIGPIMRHNFPGATFRCKHVSDVGKEQPKEKLDAAKVVFDMGIPVDGGEVRAMAGLSEPKDDAEIVQSQDLQQPGAADAMAAMGGEQGDEEGGPSSNGKQKPGGKQKQSAGDKPQKFAKEESDDDEGEGHWITVGGEANSETGAKHEGGTPIKITGDGRIVAGPAGLADKGIKNLADFGKTKVGEESGRYKPAQKPKRQQPHEMTLEEFGQHAEATGAKEMYSGSSGIKMAHYQHVRQAIRKGIDVPGHVSAAYPDLHTMATKKAATEALGYPPQDVPANQPTAKPTAAPNPNFGHAFNQAFTGLDTGQGNRVSLAAIRKAMPDVPRDEFDRELGLLRGEGYFGLAARDARFRPSPEQLQEDREHGIEEGGQYLLDVSRKKGWDKQAAAEALGYVPQENAKLTPDTAAQKFQDTLDAINSGSVNDATVSALMKEIGGMNGEQVAELLPKIRIHGRMPKGKAIETIKTMLNQQLEMHVKAQGFSSQSAAWSPTKLQSTDGQTVYTADGALLDVKQDAGKWTVGNKKNLDAWSAAALLNELKAEVPQALTAAPEASGLKGENKLAAKPRVQTKKARSLDFSEPTAKQGNLLGGEQSGGGKQEGMFSKLSKMDEREEEARKYKIKPEELHAAAKFLMETEGARSADFDKMLQSARKTYGNLTQGKQLSRSMKSFKGGDYASIPAFDVLAKEVSREHPDFFGAATGHGESTGSGGDDTITMEKLFNYLATGPQGKMGEDEAYRRALEMILEERQQRNAAVPFSRAAWAKRMMA
jgi:hypothetical protein